MKTKTILLCTLFMGLHAPQAHGMFGHFFKKVVTMYGKKHTTPKLNIPKKNTRTAVITTTTSATIGAFCYFVADQLKKVRR
jgi:hypothetical protein